MKTRSKLQAILANKCPHCREGEMFTNKNPYSFTKMATMHDNCPKCGQKYQIEPGFYFGAMYVSYALSGGFGLVLFGLMHYLTDWEFERKLWISFMALVLVTPPFFRYSRVIWLSGFVAFDPEWQNKPLEGAKE